MPSCIYPYPFIINDAYHRMSVILRGAFGRSRIRGRTEEHHIIPKSLDPSLKKVKWNLVHLMYPEHFEVHQLLPECLPNGEARDKMIVVAYLMKQCFIYNQLPN